MTKTGMTDIRKAQDSVGLRLNHIFEGERQLAGDSRPRMKGTKKTKCNLPSLRKRIGDWMKSPANLADMGEESQCLLRSLM